MCQPSTKMVNKSQWIKINISILVKVLSSLVCPYYIANYFNIIILHVSA